MKHSDMMSEFRKKFIVSVIATIPVLILSPTVQGLFGYAITFIGYRIALFLLSSFVFLYGGFPFLKGLFRELKNKNPGMMTLIGLAISVAYLYSTSVVFGLQGKLFFWELVTLIDVMLLGHWIEMKSVMSASHALHKLAGLIPEKAHKKEGDVLVSELIKGDIIIVKPGERIPTDGIILEGKSYVDESMLTGESIPVEKTQGNKVIGGSLNQHGALKVEVQKTKEENYLSGVIKMVKEAQKSKSKTQKFADRAAKWLTIAAITAGLATFAYWWTAREFVFALERMATVMVITCPHALGLAIPLVAAVSTSKSAQQGILIRNRTQFENAGKISAILFDKTGTLTKGNFAVTNIKVIDKRYNKKTILQLAYSLEKLSEHPIAAGILRETGVKPLGVKNFRAIEGVGVEGYIGGYHIEVVSSEQVKSNHDGSKGTTVYVLKNSIPIGSITLSDEIRQESYEAVKRLKEKGIKCWMITGDNEKVARNVSKRLDLDGYYANVLPDQKRDKVKMLQETETVAMVGDGINDAPALAQSDIGIAFGSGTDIAAETADIILVDDDPRDVSRLIELGKKTKKKMIQNLFYASGYNIIAIPLAAGVLYEFGILISPAAGAVLMSLSTVVVAINARTL